MKDVGCWVYSDIRQDLLISRIYPTPLENHKLCHKNSLRKSVLIMWRCYSELHTDEYLQVVDQNVAFKGKQNLDWATVEVLTKCHWRGTYFGQLVHDFVERAQWQFHMSKCYRTICSIFQETGTSVIWQTCFRRTQQVVNSSFVISILLHCKLECDSVAITQAVKQQA
jgi:hypothetical protein